MSGVDDILSALSRHDTQPLVDNLGRPGGDTRYGQGRILSWNPETFENTVAYRGGVLTNVHVLSGPDAISYREGDTLAIQSWSPNRGVAVHWILGRIIVPGAGKGAEAIAWMTEQLGKQVAAAVFAARVHSDTDAGTGNRSPAGFGDLDSPADPGPSVSMDISPTGSALVLISTLTQVALSSFTGVADQTGIASVRVSGNTSVSPQIIQSKYLRYRGSDTSDITDRSTAVVYIDGILNEGTNTFALEYSNGASDDPLLVTFAQRNITVIGL